MTAKNDSKCNICLERLGWIFKITELKLKFVNFLSPLVNLVIRLWMADIFWKSGVLKLPAGFLGIGKGNWDSTLYLFEEEHPVPGFSPEVAAYIGTAFEIICPILLVLGLGTRAGAAILFIMTLFIQITYLPHDSHLYWMMLLSVLIFHGPGKLSLDHVIRTKTLANDRYKKVAGVE